jgi:virginiamycin B lyase
MVAGTDAALWFTTESGKLERMTQAGRITWASRANTVGTDSLAVGSDHSIWAISAAPNNVVRATLTGALSTFQMRGYFGPLSAGPTGLVWGTANWPVGYRTRVAIGEISATGEEIPHFIPASTRTPDLAEGADGSMWFTDSAHARIGRVTPSGHVRIYNLPGRNHGGTWGIAPGPQHTVWFTEGSTKPEGQGLARIGRITPQGKIKEFILKPPFDRPFGSIVEGPDQAMWFTAGAVPPGGPAITGAVERISQTGRIRLIARYLNTYSWLRPELLAAGPGHAVWLASATGIGRLNIK